jgi:PKD repeat protein
MKHNRRIAGILFLLFVGLVAGGCALFRNHSPVAAFTIGYNEVPGEPLAVVLDASTSSDPDGDAIIAYMWTFTPGAKAIHPLGVESQTVYVPTLVAEFEVQDEYTVSLAVRDEKGNDSLTVYRPVTVPNAQVGPTK